MTPAEELRSLSESTHPMHGDLARVAKELGRLRAQVAAQAEAEAGYREGYRSVIREVSAERDALRHELAQLCGSIRGAYAQAVEDDQQSPIIDLVAHLIEIGRQKRRENKAIIKERDALRAELEAESREHAVDVSKCSSTINELRAELAEMTRRMMELANELTPRLVLEAERKAAVEQMVEALEEARHYVAVYGSGGRPNELLEQMRAALDAAKAIQK